MIPSPIRKQRFNGLTLELSQHLAQAGFQGEVGVGQLAYRLSYRQFDLSSDVQRWEIRQGMRICQSIIIKAIESRSIRHPVQILNEKVLPL